MINLKILKIASDTKFMGLKDDYTHKTSAKNKSCGDKIKIEVIVKNKKIKLIRYETDSCVFCQASASLLANYIKLLSVESFKKNYEILSKSQINGKKIPKKFQFINILVNKKNKSRHNCIMLPFNALSKALNV